MPAAQYRSIGKKAVLTCSFHGVPSANVSWNFEGRKNLTDKSTTVNNTSILKLRKLKKRDTGSYFCVAYNRAGKTEIGAYVKVKCEYPLGRFRFVEVLNMQWNYGCH